MSRYSISVVLATLTLVVGCFDYSLPKLPIGPPTDSESESGSDTETDMGSDSTETDSDSESRSDTDTATDTGSDTGDVNGCDNPPDPPEVGHVCIPDSIDSDAPDCEGDPIDGHQISCSWLSGPVTGYHCKYMPGFFDQTKCPAPHNLPTHGDPCETFPMETCLYDNGDGTAEHVECATLGCGAFWSRTQTGGDLKVCETCDPNDDKCDYSNGLYCQETSISEEYACQTDPYQGGSDCCGSVYMGIYGECTTDMLGALCSPGSCDLIGSGLHRCTCNGWLQQAW